MDVGKWVYAFFNNAGPGGVVVILVIGLAITIYVLLTRWILRGGEGEKEAGVSLQRFRQ